LPLAKNNFGNAGIKLFNLSSFENILLFLEENGKVDELNLLKKWHESI
jgi:hypothetical protein